jgi:tetratricopeptide (TPR) repeat protein
VPDRVEIRKGDKSLDIQKAWFDSESAVEKLASQKVFEARPPMYRFILAESSYWHGDVERAFDRYLSILQTSPKHPLNRWVCARLYELRDDVTGYESALEPVLSRLEYRQLTPLARSYAAWMGRYIHRHRWRISKSNAPLNGDAIGYPWNWMASPRLSPWRLSDFGRSYDLVGKPGFDGRILSPYFAEEVDSNQSRRRPYLADGRSLYPPFNSDGVYALETFVEVDSTKKWQTYWLVADFSSRTTVSIDGKKVLSRREKSYSEGKQFRQIQLAPGEHRIVVKLGYENNYRDWFDLMLLNLEGTPLGGSRLQFSRTAPVDDETKQETFDKSGIELETAKLPPRRLEPIDVSKKDALRDASAMELYLTALGGFFAREAARFDRAWSALMEQKPDFAPAVGLHSQFVQTLWEMPSNRRQSESHSDLREAHQLNEDSLFYLTRLVRRLRGQRTRSPKVERMLERARELAMTKTSDGSSRLKNIEPFEQWASYLTKQGWGHQAEEAWRRVLALDPGNCEAATSLYRQLRSKHVTPDLAELTPRWRECPDLYQTVAMNHPGWASDKDKYVRQMANRYPYKVGWQLQAVSQLVNQDEWERAVEVLNAAINRRPNAVGLWERLVGLVLKTEGKEAAIERLQSAMERIGRNGLFTWMLAELTEQVPLDGLLKDGRDAAMKAIENNTAKQIKDDAYYVIDSAARKYFDNGDSILLTHYVVRMMSKDSIDSFGEVSVPNNARLLRARTIKQDGETRIPKQTTAKSAMSMPALEKGDFVEIAYLQYKPGSKLSSTRRDGTRFYFRMSDISSLKSQYRILNPMGDVHRSNSAPEKRKISLKDSKAWQFTETNSNRPPAEPYTVPWSEYLPWIQLHSNGTTLSNRRLGWNYVADRVENGLKQSFILSQRVGEWVKNGPEGELPLARHLFYKVNEQLTSFQTNRGFGQDATHTLLTGEGNSLVLLKAVYDIAGLDSDIYLAKSRLANQQVSPLHPLSNYGVGILRLQLGDGTTKWLNPRGRYAMFNAVSLTILGQNAVCVTCRQLKTSTLPGKDGFRRAERRIDISGELSERGDFKGTIQANIGGIRANVIRQRLARSNGSGNERDYIRQILSGILPSADLESFEVANRRALDEALTLQMDVRIEQFARAAGANTLSLERRLFEPRVYREYARLNRRETPMLINGQLDSSFSMAIQLPERASLNMESKTGSWTRSSEFGEFRRTVESQNGQLFVKSSIEMPIQRVSPEKYDGFQRWAGKISQDSVVWGKVQTSDIDQRDSTSSK